jgi:primosomal protein N'
MAKLRGEHRVQIFLKGGHRSGMREAVLAALEAEPDMRRRVAIDIDPVSIL